MTVLEKLTHCDKCKKETKVFYGVDGYWVCSDCRFEKKKKRKGKD